jgi:hypothetical protein
MSSEGPLSPVDLVLTNAGHTQFYRVTSRP